jgi:transposase InsO family protein
MIASGQYVSKRELAKRNGISISSLYYRPKKPAADWHLKNQIERVLSQHPSYGYRRIALELGINNKRAKRVMRKFGIKPYRRRGRKWRKAKENGQVFPNLLQQLEFPKAPGIAWASDFTHINFHSKILYLATIKDIFDRRIVGWSLLANHSVQLTIAALIDAVEKHGRPMLLHSDQGSEYKSRVYTQLAMGLGIKLSMSHKGSPWENGYQESFYSQFKVDLGDPNRFASTGELMAEIFLQIHYYNTKRIHGKLKMSPETYARAATLHKQLTMP